MPAATGGVKAILEGRKLKMAGPLPENKMFVKAARVQEGLSTITEIAVDFMSPERNLNLADLVGKPITVKMQTGDTDGGGTASGTGTGSWREHKGTCIEAQAIGVQQGYGFYALQVRPWIWFLTRTSGCRIFQNINTNDIVKKIFSDRGFADYTFSTSRTPDPRVYCVQYNETDFDFISRLMEEEGIYYYSSVKGGKDHLTLTDGQSGHQPIPGNATVDFEMRLQGMRRSTDHIFDWRSSERVTTGKVTLIDYDFERPKADLKTVKAMPKGSHAHKDYERYGYPGHYRVTALGDYFSRVKMEAQAWPNKVRDAVGVAREIAVGKTFTLAKQTPASENLEYVTTSALHMMQIEVDAKDESQKVSDVPGSIKFDEENKDTYRVTFKTIPKSVQYRAALTTQWPKMPSLLIAKVTGPSGEEIHTDKYGRIKVQFPWDRDHDFKGDGKGHDTSSCWVRVATPWAGVKWGMIHVPRIGQEVLIQFEDGDIDRPICTGMIYNADTMPPYDLDANKTQMGIKTRSSKGGGADNYNELVFEDKKDAEFIRMHSEKDYFLTVENDATISIGETKKSPGSVTTTIHKDRTETIKTGDLTLKVESGNESRDIKTNRTEKIGSNASQEVGGNKSTKVTGNAETAVTGTSKTEVTGTTDHKSTGAMTIESPASITLKVGGNSIKIDPSGITITGTMIKTDATGMAEHKSGGIMTVQGSLVNIN